MCGELANRIEKAERRWQVSSEIGGIGGTVPGLRASFDFSMSRLGEGGEASLSTMSLFHICRMTFLFPCLHRWKEVEGKLFMNVVLLCT